MKKEIYFNPKKYLPYQRNFIMINSERNIGKTYSTQKFFIERYLKYGERFVYYVRTQDEKKNGVFKDAFGKVLSEQFKNETFIFNSNQIYWREDEKNKESDKLCGVCVALSEANKSKKVNYPICRWGLFDEYILDTSRINEYINGFDEPKLFLKLYHTLDREQDYQTVFMLGNNISFYNPYHIYKAFNVPYQGRNKIWMNENVLYEHIEGSEELKENKKKSKFLHMIENTDYGKYAIEGEFSEDNKEFIEPRSNKAKLKFNFDVNKKTFGVWWDNSNGLVYIDNKFNPYGTIWYTFDDNAMSSNKTYVKSKEAYLCKWLGTMFKRGCIRWVSMDVKVVSMEGIKKML